MNISSTIQHVFFSAVILLGLSACHAQKGTDEREEERVKLERLLSNSSYDEARQQIAQGLATASDSDSYYKYVALQSKYHFVVMNVDSFLDCNRRLSAYLDRCTTPVTTERQRLIVDCELQRGVYEGRMTGNVKKAVDHYKKVIELIGNSHDAELVNMRLLTLINMADAYKQMGAFDQAVGYFREAMELSDQVGMSDELEVALDMGIASAYTSMHSFDQSAKWWNKAEAYFDEMKLSDKFLYLNNRGNDFYLQERYGESLECFALLDSLLKDNSKMQWERMFGKANLADLYMKKGDYGQAQRFLDEAQAFFEQHHMTVVLYYLQTQRIELAMKKGLLNKALTLAATDTLEKEQIIPEQVLLRLRVLNKLYEQSKLWQQAVETQRGYYHLLDSIDNGQTKMRFSTVLLEYEHSKRMMEKEHEVEEHELKDRIIQLFLLVSVVIIVFLLVVTILSRRQRKLREMAVRGTIANLHMETVRNRITPHFISNALSAEMLAQMEGQPVDISALVQLMKRGIEMTGTEQITLHDELEFIRFFCKIESRSVGPDFRLDINLQHDVDDQRVVLPSMLIQILVENAIKHGLKQKPMREGHYRQVDIDISRMGEGTLVEVIDNGIGLLEGREKSEHTGLMVMRKTIMLLNEQQTARAGRNCQTMEFYIENYTHDNGDTGCRAWLFLPDDFEYTFRKQ